MGRGPFERAGNRGVATDAPVIREICFAAVRAPVQMFGDKVNGASFNVCALAWSFGKCMLLVLWIRRLSWVVVDAE